ncbi:MAG TPA: UDP-N-acetylglucosamine 2-epimerase [Planctomycetota bacterium]|nr:UDP-N-acetylglucosamine 2-epimerase [Planctomycetota bacterium]
MKLLTVVAPGGEEARRAVSVALGAWTRGLDIRLRFLNIGFEERVVVLEATKGPGEPAAAALLASERAIDREKPAVVLLHGGGPAALAAAVSAAKAGVPVVRTAAGDRRGPGADEERAADRLATVRLAPEEALAALRDEGLDGEPFTPEAAVRAALRIQREA